MQSKLTFRPSLLPGWLIEPCLHIELPLLLEVLVCDDIIMLHHCDASWPCKQCMLSYKMAAKSSQADEYRPLQDPTFPGQSHAVQMQKGEEVAISVECWPHV